MARWIGDPGVTAVLEAGDAWRDRCFLGNGSILTDRSLWTLPNLTDLVARYADNPIVGSTRDFLDKLHEQLRDAPTTTTQLAAEVMWFLHLFPSGSTLKAATKREQVLSIWSWSGEPAPTSPFLDDAHLHGVGNPGTAYFTHRPSEFEYVLRVMIAFKSLPPAEQGRLMQDDIPWEFMTWLDKEPGSDRRLVRGAILYFLFPDHLERNMSKDHKRQIYDALKSKLPSESVIKSRQPTLMEYDRAIAGIRAALMAERGTMEFDFYQDGVKNLWFTSIREGGVKDFSSWLNAFLADQGVQYNQSGRDVKKLDDKRKIEETTGFWADASYVTGKPPRWLIHLDATGAEIEASVPAHHRAGVIGYANTKGGNSGALSVRILPVVKLGDQKFQVVEHWEWLLIFCFPGGLRPGSSGEAFENFDVVSGTLTYLKEPQPYIFSALLSLNLPEDEFSAEVNGVLKTITYRAATSALTKMIHIAPIGGANE